MTFAAWRNRWRARRGGLPVTVVIDADRTAPADAAGYFAEIAAHLDACPEPLRVRIRAPGGWFLDALPDGRLSISSPAGGAHAFSLRGRWIADHPVPLELAPPRLRAPRWLPVFPSDCVTLSIRPESGNRFRVKARAPWWERLRAGVGRGGIFPFGRA